MAKRRYARSDDLFISQGSAIPVGMAETCKGCGKIIDLRQRNGWAILGNGWFIHENETCWRGAMDREQRAMKGQGQ